VPSDDPRFWSLREALASYASDPDDPPVADDDTIQAAVSVVLRGRAELELLLIKRARSERDPWSGHMALPGGRRDPEDDSLVGTAIRETREETGLALGDHALHLGRLDPVAPRSVRLPRISIHPFVFGTHGAVEARADPGEVAAIHWLPLARVRAPDAVESVEIEVHGESRTFPCYRWKGEVVWGLTFRILQQFLEAAPELLGE